MAEENYMDKLLSYMPYDMLIETDGGPDRTIVTLQKKLAIFDLLLTISVDKIIVIRGCPVLLYIKTV